MVFAFAYNTAKELRVLDDTTLKRLLNTTHTTVTLFLSTLALVVSHLPVMSTNFMFYCFNILKFKPLSVLW